MKTSFEAMDEMRYGISCLGIETKFFVVGFSTQLNLFINFF